MYVYPGFILYRASRQAFALIAFHKASLKFVSTQFTEADTVPSDTQVIGQTWAKANKDGSRDRRFQGNHQIPVAHYGSLLFTSSDGLDVRYLCSNAALAKRFAKAWAAFRMSFSRDSQQEVNADNSAKKRKPPFKAIEEWYRAFERSMAVYDKFKVTQDRYVSSIAPIAQEGEQDPAYNRAVSHEVVTTYLTAVLELIAADKAYEECSELVSQSGRSNFRRALQNAEICCAALQESLSSGCITAENWKPFEAAIVALIHERGVFLSAGATAMEQYGAKE
jgi:hypothetical protein